MKGGSQEHFPGAGTVLRDLRGLPEVVVEEEVIDGISSVQGVVGGGATAAAAALWVSPAQRPAHESPHALAVLRRCVAPRRLGYQLQRRRW